MKGQEVVHLLQLHLLSKLIGKPKIKGGLDNTQPITGTPFVGPGSLVKTMGMFGKFLSSKPGKVVLGMFMNATGQFNSHSLKMKLSQEEWSFGGVMRRIDWVDTGFSGALSLLGPVNTKFLGSVPNPMPVLGMSFVDGSVEKGLSVSGVNKSIYDTGFDFGANALGYGITAFRQLGSGFLGLWSGFVSPNFKTFGKAGPLNPKNENNLFERYGKDTKK